MTRRCPRCSSRSWECPGPTSTWASAPIRHARQTAAILAAFEDVCDERQPDLVIVSGDVNSTLAAALVAAKRQIPVAHVEAGLRSFDRTMPEEVNRVVVDHLSSLLFVTEASGVNHLRREGIAAERIHLVGNCMVDSLLAHVELGPVARPLGAARARARRLRPPDAPSTRRTSMTRPPCGGSWSPSTSWPSGFRSSSRSTREPGHGWARATRRWLRPFTWPSPSPISSFLGLMAGARAVLTDSGGIQEETTALGVPCLTLRENTERPITLTEGTNRLVGTDPDAITDAVDTILAGRWPAGRRPLLWDGRAAVRIADVVVGTGS